MKSVNLKFLAFKYKLAKRLNASIEKDKNAIKEGATITFKDYCKLQLVECTKKSWSKEAQTIAEKHLTDLGFEKQETKYIRIDIDNVPTEIDNEIDNVLNTLENNDNKIVTRVASAVANIK